MRIIQIGNTRITTTSAKAAFYAEAMKRAADADPTITDRKLFKDLVAVLNPDSAQAKNGGSGAAQYFVEEGETRFLQQLDQAGRVEGAFLNVLLANSEDEEIMQRLTPQQVEASGNVDMNDVIAFVKAARETGVRNDEGYRFDITTLQTGYAQHPSNDTQVLSSVFGQPNPTQETIRSATKIAWLEGGARGEANEVRQRLGIVTSSPWQQPAREIERPLHA